MKLVFVLSALAVTLSLPSLLAAENDLPAPAPLLAQAGAAPARDLGVAAAAPLPADAPPDSFAIHSGPAGQKPVDTTINLWELVKSGGWAMVPLGVLSVVTVMLLIVFLFTLRRGAILTPHFMNTADVLLKKRDYLGLLAISSRHSEMVARIVQRTLDFATKNPAASFDTIREIAEAEGSAQSASLQHRITFLADIGVISPMIGLLGTVIGIIRAFAKLGSGDASISRDILLASGVSEALIATASGLVLGILAMGCYGLFRNKVHSLISDMEIASTHILALLGVSFHKKREQSRVAIEDDF